MLTREEILKANDMKHVDVAVPEWGGTVRVRVMSGAARQRFQLLCGQDAHQEQSVMERLLVACAVDADGTPLFTDADVKALSEKSNVVMIRLFDAAAKLNCMTKGSVDDLKGE